MAEMYFSATGAINLERIPNNDQEELIEQLSRIKENPTEYLEHTPYGYIIQINDYYVFADFDPNDGEITIYNIVKEDNVRKDILNELA